jgi:hypothetical protein
LRKSYDDGTKAALTAKRLSGLPVERDCERSQQMSEKIYCKDCRFCINGFCHRMPPALVSWHKDALFPKVDNFDWCGMAEPREKEGQSLSPWASFEAGDAVCVCKYGDTEELKEENNRLRGLITEIREFLIGGAIPGHVHLKQEFIREIYTIASEEDEKRRAGK